MLNVNSINKELSGMLIRGIVKKIDGKIFFVDCGSSDYEKREIAFAPKKMNDWTLERWIQEVESVRTQMLNERYGFAEKAVS